MLKTLFQPGYPTSRCDGESGPSSIVSSAKFIGFLGVPGGAADTLAAKRIFLSSGPRLESLIVMRGLNLSGSDTAFFNENMMRDAMSGVKIVTALETKIDYSNMSSVSGKEKAYSPG